MPQLPHPMIIKRGAAMAAPMPPIQFWTGASVAESQEGSLGL